MTSYVPANGLHDMDLQALAAAYQEFCEAENLTPKSADELRLEVTEPHQIAWLDAFLKAWEVEA